ncbi:MAG TPA: hypothetical protein VFG25_01590, partial [Nitrosopumilaceae archaeon]|nr:hypothetical protein [Nitrosopumilaceae archaeon]
VSYDVCEENIVRIIVSNDDTTIPTVTIETEFGTVEAKLAEDQPFEELNKFTTVDKYLFEAPLDSSVESILIEATALVGSQTISTTSTIQITECSEIIIFEKAQPEYEDILVDAPQIYDTKFQIGDDIKRLAQEESEKHYIENEPVTISTILYSNTSLEVVELRIASLEKPLEFVSLEMPLSSLPISNASLASVTIPSDLVTSPGISYWIYVEDENQVSQESPHFEIGVITPVKPVASIELDTLTSKHEGSMLRTSAYVDVDTNAYGTVSLFVNDVKETTKSLLLVKGQTKVDLDWYIPEKEKQMTYELRAEVEIYGESTSTEITKLHTFPKTQIISISEMKPILPLSDETGNVIAKPTSVYASDHFYENLRLQVITKDGYCLVGPADNCAVQESTSNEFRGQRDIVHNDQIYGIKLLIDEYTSFESVLIDTVDQIPSELKVTLVPKEKQKVSMEDLFDDFEESIEEPIDEPINKFVPPIFASEDIKLKVKYKAVSEIVTVKST